MKRTSYHVGGFVAGAPQQNRADEFDSVAGTFTRWNAAGSQIEQRALTAQEQADLASGDAAVGVLANRGTIESRARQALAANATYLALATPSAAQNTAQAKALTRQVNALIKLLLNDLADVNGT